MIIFCTLFVETYLAILRHPVDIMKVICIQHPVTQDYILQISMYLQIEWDNFKLLRLTFFIMVSNAAD